MKNSISTTSILLITVMCLQLSGCNSAASVNGQLPKSLSWAYGLWQNRYGYIVYIGDDYIQSYGQEHTDMDYPYYTLPKYSYQCYQDGTEITKNSNVDMSKKVELTSNSFLPRIELLPQTKTLRLGEEFYKIDAPKADDAVTAKYEDDIANSDLIGEWQRVTFHLGYPKSLNITTDYIKRYLISVNGGYKWLIYSTPDDMQDGGGYFQYRNGSLSIYSALDDGWVKYKRSTNRQSSSSFNSAAGTNNRSYVSFTSAGDVVAYLRSRSFVNGELTMRFTSSAEMTINGETMTGAMDIVSFDSSSARLYGVSPYTGSVNLFVNAETGTITNLDEPSEVFRLSNKKGGMKMGF